MYNKSSIPDILHEFEEMQVRQSSTSSDNTAMRSRPEGKSPYLAEIERQMVQLAEMIKVNNAKQEEIRALRDGVSTSMLSFGLSALSCTYNRYIPVLSHHFSYYPSPSLHSSYYFILDS
jgi:hypothetical protein